MPIRINRIYTRGGDGGETSLGDATRVSKTATRITAMGAIDELNATLGFARAAIDASQSADFIEQLEKLQNLLFELGADLSVPEVATTAHRIQPRDVDWIESTIDAATEQLAPLTSFVLPGGKEFAARLHLARTVCRRAEVELFRLHHEESVPEIHLQFINRLSDLLFAMARLANEGGRNDMLWRPRPKDEAQ